MIAVRISKPPPFPPNIYKITLNSFFFFKITYSKETHPQPSKISPAPRVEADGSIQQIGPISLSQ